ncbi:MAG: ATP-binding protein [Deltaproteobacteria bacterium]|nr:MAG: ATP-binding protein [Deltaproteobacteria bacterium]
MNALELQEDIIDVLTAGLAPMIVGSPGIGKSDIIRMIAEKFKLSVIDMRLSQCDPTDMLGFPTHNGDRMGYAPPEHFPLQELDTPPSGFDGWLLFLDEFSSAPLAVQAAAYKLVLDRQVGKHKLHKKVAIVCAGNKATDGAITNRMSTAMQSRLVHLELEVDVESWVHWATSAQLDHRCISYIEGRPEHLHQFDPNHNDSTFACPRTWEFASKLIKDKEISPRLLGILIGTLSAGVAHEFNAYLAYCSELPSIADIIARPDDIAMPNEPSLLYATSHMVAAYLKETNSERLMRYIKRLPLEFGVTATRSALKRNSDLLKLPHVRDWAHEVAKELF